MVSKTHVVTEPTWGLENEGAREKQTELIFIPQNCHIIMFKGTHDFL